MTAPSTPTMRDPAAAVPASSAVFVETIADRVRVPTPSPRSQSGSKRFIDVSIAALGLLILAPLLLVAAVLVRAFDAGPVLFRQERVGLSGRSFVMLKFRSMCPDAELRLAALLNQNEGSGPLFKLRRDPRITPLGRLLRRTSIDELPQLWNVLRGDMSLVGPRPALPREVAQWDSRAFHRLAVKPGITGPWQVGGRSDLGWENGLDLDLDYVANGSTATDLWILCRTVSHVAQLRGAY